MSQTMCERAKGKNIKTDREKKISKLSGKQAAKLVVALDRLFVCHPEPYRTCAEALLLAAKEVAYGDKFFASRVGNPPRARFVEVIQRAISDQLHLAVDEDCGKLMRGSF